MILKWRFPATRRDCLKINYRSIAKLESLVPSEYNRAINLVLAGFPQSVIRVVSYLGLNYLHPHNKQIV